MTSSRPQSPNDPPPPPLQECQDTEAPISTSVIHQKRKGKLSAFFGLRKSSLQTRPNAGRTNSADSNLQSEESNEERIPTGVTRREPTGEITTEDARHEDDETLHSNGKDIFSWAILYENQRGITAFAVPYYGTRSLLPNDPPPFTVPIDPNDKSKDSKESMKACTTLNEFEPPDPQWIWVSKSWMVDMRGDGDVSHEGFQYNWYFRKSGWRPYPGPLNSGGWVRRRRWIRLMMKPAVTATPLPASGSRTTLSRSHSRLTLPSSSVHDPVADNDYDPDDDTTSASDGCLSDLSPSIINGVWQGVLEEDWRRCRRVLRSFGTDGKRLELWEVWLQPHDTRGDQTIRFLFSSESLPSRGKGKARDRHSGSLVQSPVEEIVPPSERRWITDVLEKHGAEVLSLFIFPTSRADFRRLLHDSGIDPRSLDPVITESESGNAEFWSRRSMFVTGNTAEHDKQIGRSQDEADGPKPLIELGTKEKAASSL